MSADLLVRASRVLREHAEAATPGPWFRVAPPWNDHTAWMTSGDPDPHKGQFLCDFDADMAGAELDEDEINDVADADFVALMHPPVALALAQLLEAHAVAITQWAEIYAGRERIGDLTEADEAAAALARAVLREEPTES